MASSSKQQLRATTIFVVAALILLLVCARGHAARPVPGSNDNLHMQQRAVSATVAEHEKSGSSSGPGMEMHQAEPAEAMRDCEGEEDGEECLLRRTLVAHTDYIYTQGNHN
ncbi:hypothetical protein U9M48_006674 [Paspalum notatum var. saurae]|uniref:Phytosulfokine n=1 Tax=Paspalum notatum var. saurae TaxID=547442 RepID=A0AAQ3PUX7_PASNO